MGCDYVLGVDLSGPANTADTAAVWFTIREHGLELVDHALGCNDADLLELATGLGKQGSLVIGLDAPLSYQPGGGDRARDKALRSRIFAAGLSSGSVMTPTMTRMVYLTLRGLAVTRLLESIRPTPPRIVEVHPGACLVLRGASSAAVRSFKSDPTVRHVLLTMLEQQGLRAVNTLATDQDHLIAACAGALAAWRWSRGEAVWLAPMEPPHHPYDFAC